MALFEEESLTKPEPPRRVEQPFALHFWSPRLGFGDPHNPRCDSDVRVAHLQSRRSGSKHRHHPLFVVHRHVRGQGHVPAPWRLDTSSTSQLRQYSQVVKTREVPSPSLRRFRRTAAEEEGSDTAPLLDKAGSYPSSPERSARWSSGERVGMGEKGGYEPLSRSHRRCDWRRSARSGATAERVDDVNALRES